MLRCFDVLFSMIGILFLLPLFLLISLIILTVDGPPVFYLQDRVGRGGTDFRLIKFRSMRKHADRSGQLTIGGRDPRITPVGYFLRKYKLDELPQLFNVLLGSMSLVGPRPEVRKYVSLYTAEQRKVLTVRPGISDEASIRYVDESAILLQSPDPERFYIDVVMPEKLHLNKSYIDHPSVRAYFSIIFRTVVKVVFR